MAQVKEGSGRWAIIIKDTQTVSNINVGEEPERPNDQKSLTDVVQVDDEVKIGMIRSGSGFAWPEGHKNVSENKSLGDNAGTATRLEGMDRSRGSEVPKKPEPEGPTPQPESMKPAPAKQETGEEPAPAPVTPQAQAAAGRAPAASATRTAPKAAAAKPAKGASAKAKRGRVRA